MQSKDMILPIMAYGHPILRKATQQLASHYKDLDVLIKNMFETMYDAHGVGLAAPQIGLSIRLFIVDASGFSEMKELSEEEKKFLSTFRKVFINPKIISESGEPWSYNEGCLSIPGIHEDIYRPPKIKIEYYDAQFNKKIEELNGLSARVVQHEYDHLEGILFTDKLSALKRKILKSKMNRISKGDIDTDFKMNFYKSKK